MKNGALFAFDGNRVAWISDDYFESFLVPQLLRELKRL